MLFKKDGTVTETELLELAGRVDVRIIENAVERLFLVEASMEAIIEIEAALPGWTVGTEIFHSRPERPMEKVETPPGCTQPEDTELKS